MSRTNHPRQPIRRLINWKGHQWPRSHRVWDRSNGAGEYARIRNRAERRQARVDLQMGREPFPHQGRSRAKWDAW